MALAGYNIQGVPWRSLQKRLVLWNVGTGKRLWTAESPDPLTPVALFAKRKIALVHRQNSLQEWDIDKGEPGRVLFEDKVNTIKDLVVSSNGDLALAVHYSKEGSFLGLWSVTTGKRLRKFETRATISTIALSPDGRWALVSYFPTEHNDVAIELWNTGTGKVEQALSQKARWAPPFAFSHDSTCATCTHYQPASSNTHVAILSVPDFRQIHELEPGGAIRTYGLSPTCKELLMSFESGSLRSINLQTMQVIWEKSRHGHAIAVSADYKRVLTVWGGYSDSRGGSLVIRLIDLTSGQTVNRLY